MTVESGRPAVTTPLVTTPLAGQALETSGEERGRRAAAGAVWREIVTGLGLFAAAVALFAAVQWATPGIVGNDGYYHIKMGYLIRQEGLKPTFEALPHTILNPDAYYDHHLLFHMFMAPFAGVDPAVDGGAALAQGAKIAGVVLSALSVLGVWWLLRGQNVPYAAVWALGLFAVSEAFLYRMSMARAQSGAVLLLALALHWLLTGRHKWLAVLGFVFVWFYNAFPLLMVVAGIYVVAVFMLERRVAWMALVYPAVGIVLGILINPYFPENVAFIAGHVLPKLGEPTAAVGNEWSPYQTWTLVRNSGHALAAVLLGTLALGWREDRIDRASLVGLGLVGVFGFMLFQSRRFVEYFPAFALIFLAFTSAPLLARRRAAFAAGQNRRGYAAAAVAGLLLLAGLTLVTIRDARDLVANNKPADLYTDAMLFLREHSGSLSAAPSDPTDDLPTVFQTDWDDFTRQFFYFDRARYINGLDPTFMQMHDEALFDEWVAITRGRVETPGAIIRDRFEAEYVFTDLEHTAFLRAAEGDPALREIYRDEYAAVFVVVE